MANGQQSVVTGQQQPIDEQQNQRQNQQPTVYQTFMSMNPQQLREFQANYYRIQQKDEVLRNVGDVRLEQYESEIASGKMTWSQAVEQSKSDLSPISTDLDNIYYKRDKEGKRTITSSELALWHEQNKNKIGYDEGVARRYDIRYNATISKENARDVELGKLSKTEADNWEHLKNYRNDWTTFNNTIDRATSGLYKTDKYGRKLYFTDPETKTQSRIIGDIKEENVSMKDGERISKPTFKKAISKEDEVVLSNAINAIETEHYKDLGITIVDGKPTPTPETRGLGDRDAVYDNIRIIANLVPLSFLKEKKGFYIGVNDAFVEIPFRTGDEFSFRRKFAEELSKKYLKAIDHLPNLRKVGFREAGTGFGAGRQEQPQQAETQQAPEIPTVSSAADYNNLPSGTVFIDPEGNKRTKP